MKVFKLGQDEERGHGFTHRIQLTSADFSAFTTAGAAGTITLLTALAGYVITAVAARLVTPFQAAGDAANNSTALTIGKSGTLNQLLASTELNANGSYVGVATQPSTVPAGYSVDTPIVATFTPVAGKTLAALTAGEVDVFINMRSLDRLV
jgi:hypothetical protein